MSPCAIWMRHGPVSLGSQIGDTPMSASLSGVSPPDLSSIFASLQPLAVSR